MAVKRVATSTYRKDYIGLSTDTKPTDCGVGSTFWESDTRAAYVFTGSAWALA